jgi:excisionase family DNA binding protein
MAKGKNNLEKSSRFMTLAEVQLYLGIKSRKTLLKYIKAGKLAAIKMGGTRWRVQRSHVRAFINGSPKNGHPAAPKEGKA